MQAVCSAISPLEHALATRYQALKHGTDANPAQAKKNLERFLTAIAHDSDQAVWRIRFAGAPDISNGPTVAAEIVKPFTQLRELLRTAAARADSLPTNSPTSYAAAARALSVGIRGSIRNIDASGPDNPEIEQAAAHEPACESLG